MYLLAVRGSVALLLALLTLFPLLYLATEPTYDEAVYLSLARRIADTGLPLRRDYNDFTRFTLFANSPPLVLYVASLSQHVLPGNEVAPRLAHILLFAVPTYALVWRIGRDRYGPWAGVAGLAALLASGSYLRATTHVQLDVPLGCLAIVVLFAFEKAYGATGRPRHGWALVAALAMILATWTKYQAVCIALAVGTFCLYSCVTRGHRVLRQLLFPLGSLAAAGLVAVTMLLAFFLMFDQGTGLSETWRFNAGRMSIATMSAEDVARDLLGTAREIEGRLGGVLLFLALVAPLIERRHRDWLVLLTAYVAVSLVFNLWVFRLPGSGAKYLDSVVPALALLAGPSFVALINLARAPTARWLLPVAALAVQLTGSPQLVYALPKFNGVRAAADYIASTSDSTAGVLAPTVAIEFYSGRPVRAIPFTSHEVLLRSLEDSGGHGVAFVVLPGGVLPPRVHSLQRQWDELLDRHFEVAPVEIPGILVYRRKK